MPEDGDVIIVRFNVRVPRSQARRSWNMAYEKDPKRIDVDDSSSHGGWWKTTKFAEIQEKVAIQFGRNSYVKILDDGFLQLGPPHKEGEGPHPDEIFTAVRMSNIKIALKSPYGKFVREERDGLISARSDSVGSTEMWEPIYQRGRMALLSESKHFWCIHPEDYACVAMRRKVRAPEIAVIRCHGPRPVSKEKAPPQQQQQQQQQQQGASTSN